MLLLDRNHLEKMYSSRKANQEAMFRHPRLKPHLPSHRRLPDPLQLIVLPLQMQQARSRKPLPPARIPHGGFLWCLLSVVRLLQRVVNGHAAHGQLFSLPCSSFVSLIPTLFDFGSFMSRTHFIAVCRRVGGGVFFE